MRIARRDLERAVSETIAEWDATSPEKVRAICEGYVKALGIEIVPDPEPELPPRPWRLKDGGNHPGFVMIVDRDGNTVFGAQVVGWREPQFAALESLVSAGNAAGERIRIRIGRDPEVLPNDRGPYVASWDGHGITACWGSREEALGALVWRHASDLGLEIVES